ncbi:hypothetical protein [Aeromonas jandaei]
MPKPPFKPTQRRLLIGSAIALALFANPFSYDFAHQEWQVTKAYAESCFVAGTRITMADGSERLIETLQAGERVLDQYGHTNQILAVERVLLGDRRLYGINQLPPFFTGEHPFLTTRGWAAISPAMTRAENPTLIVLPLFTGMRLLGWSAAANAGNLALAPQPVELLVESLYWIDAPPTTELFNLILNGTHSYIANSLIVHNKDGNGGGSDNNGGGSEHGGGEHAGGDQHAGGERHAGGELHGGGDLHAGGRGLGNGLDDNGVDAVDANGNKLRGDGTVDDNGVDTVDANGNQLRGDGTVDDRQQVLTDEQERALLNNGFSQQGQP